jgi:hypothetical protein
MKEPTLKQILLDEINKTDGWLTKGTLGLVAEKAGYLPESCGRHLRAMAEKRPDHEPEILVSYYQGKRNQTLSRYARLGEQIPLPVKPQIVVRDGVAYMI